MDLCQFVFLSSLFSLSITPSPFTPGPSPQVLSTTFHCLYQSHLADSTTLFRMFHHLLLIGFVLLTFFSLFIYIYIYIYKFLISRGRLLFGARKMFAHCIDSALDSVSFVSLRSSRSQCGGFTQWCCLLSSVRSSVACEIC